jgi:hypothetical protein
VTTAATLQPRWPRRPVTPANRTRVYSLSTGEQKGRVFGTRAAMNTTTGLMAVENGAGKLILYEQSTLQRRHELTFSHPVSMAAFSADGKRLFVLTSDQTAFVLDAGGSSGSDLPSAVGLHRTSRSRR